MPLASAALRTALDLVPPVTIAGGGPVVTITLKFQGVAYDPVNIYDMLNVQYGTVSSDRDALGSPQEAGHLDFTITP